jgi:hypothetical protein
VDHATISGNVSEVSAAIAGLREPIELRSVTDVSVTRNSFHGADPLVRVDGSVKWDTAPWPGPPSSGLSITDNNTSPLPRAASGTGTS